MANSSPWDGPAWDDSRAAADRPDGVPASGTGTGDGRLGGVRGADFRQRGVFLHATCPACPWEGPARRAFASAVRDLQAHHADDCPLGESGTPAHTEAGGSPKQATEGGLS